jgi:hypothetical protein
VAAVTAAKARACAKIGPNLKSEPRALEKAANDYDGDFHLLCDLLRGSIVVDHFEDILTCFECLQRLADNGVIEIVRLKNRFKNGSAAGSGHCDGNVNVKFRGHVCEVQLQHRPFYELKQGQHEVYEVVRSLQIEGALPVEEVPNTAPMPIGVRATVLVLLFFSAAAGLWQATLYRYYNWAAFGTWNTKQGALADVHAALLMSPFLLLSCVSFERIWRMARSRSKTLTVVAQAASAVGIVVFGISFDLSLLVRVPDPNTWFEMVGWGGNFWKKENALGHGAGEQHTHLKPVEGSECLPMLMMPYIAVGLLFLRDAVQTLRREETGVRRRPRVGMIYGEFLGPHGIYFEHRPLALQVGGVVVHCVCSRCELYRC